MPPAKRGPRFSVQDVIAAIQNGESEFEMESEESDTDACGHVDKENQQPNDPHEVPTLVRVHLLAHHHPCCDQRLAPCIQYGTFKFRILLLCLHLFDLDKLRSYEV